MRLGGKLADAEWFVPAMVIIGFELVLSLALTASGHAPMPLFDDNGLVAYVFMFVVAFARYLTFLFQLWRAGEVEPIARSIAVAKANVGRIVFAVLAVQLMGIQAACFASLKAAIPSVNPFWLDPYLMRFEAALFGKQPWQIAYSLFGPAAGFFDAAYTVWVPIQIVSIFSLLLIKPSPEKSQAIISFMLAWLIIGVFAAAALSSAGPIFYDRLYGTHDFAGLPLAGAHNTARESAMLWASHKSGVLKVGSGISAMPSMHVALALWFALVLRKTFLRHIAWAYVPIVWIGSVLLGWHYVIDGLVGLLAMLAIWQLSKVVARVSSSWRRKDAEGQTATI
jgi:hypothetical protein